MFIHCPCTKALHTSLDKENIIRSFTSRLEVKLSIVYYLNELGPKSCVGDGE